MTALYRFWADDELLYIGVTYHLRRRLRQHEGASTWMLNANRITIDWYPTRREALAAERAAIRQEAPRFNLRMLALPKEEAS